jgi:hypothetical protein
VKNVRLHVDVCNKARYLMALLDYLVQCRATVFSAAPVDNHFHANSTWLVLLLD